MKPKERKGAENSEVGQFVAERRVGLASRACSRAILEAGEIGTEIQDGRCIEHCFDMTITPAYARRSGDRRVTVQVRLRGPS